jgi:uncharacterized membrane protein
MSSGARWRWAATLFWLANGVNHFRAPKFYEAIVPPPLDRWKGPVNIAAGVAELAGGLAVVPARTRPIARWWLLATLAAVYPANIHMALRPERFPRFPPIAYWARLPFQALFALLTWRGTRS